jgi:hypothetical protein
VLRPSGEAGAAKPQRDPQKKTVALTKKRLKVQ